MADRSDRQEMAGRNLIVGFFVKTGEAAGLCFFLHVVFSV